MLLHGCPLPGMPSPHPAGISISSFHAHLNGHHFYGAFSEPLPPPLSQSKTSLLCLKGPLPGGPSCLLSLCDGHGPSLLTEPISLPEKEPAWRKQILEAQ